jgi:hypothetical protein
MIEGVTILGTEAVMTVHPLFLTFGITGISLLIIALILGIIFKNSKRELGLKFLLTFGILGTIVAFGGMSWASINKVEDYLKYDVLISEDVNFQEFYDKYEILDAKGEIYVVKEIEVND